MNGDSYTLIGLGIGALLIVWLVFSVFKKIIGLVFLVALAAGGFAVWNDPGLLDGVLEAVQRTLGA